MEKKIVKKISIVVPVYNEEANIKNLYKELKDVLDGLNKDYEIIFVDDCSQDNSAEILNKIFQKDKNVCLIFLLGNQGQTSALSAGFPGVVIFAI